MPARKGMEIEISQEEPEMKEGEEMPMDLAAVSDEELISECQKRGLKV